MNYKFRIMLLVRDKVIPLNCHISGGIMIPKIQNPRQSNLADDTQIALGNVEGKLTWSLIAQRFYPHLVIYKNLIDTKKFSSENGWMLGTLSMVWITERCSQ